MLRQFIRFLVRHFACEHKERILTMIVREPITYTRRAQYYCPRASTPGTPGSCRSRSPA